MKNQPFSIKLIHWITEGFFVFYTLITILLFIGALAVLFGYELPDGTNLSLDLPIEIDLEETGVWKTGDANIPVHLTDLEGNLTFKSVPKSIQKQVAGGILIALPIMFLALWWIRKFVKNVYRGQMFDLANIRLLKHFAWTILAVWALRFPIQLLSSGIVSGIYYPGVSLAAPITFSGDLLFVALAIWVLSHIFQKGLEMQEEQKLTV